MNKISTQELFEGVKSGDKRLLGKAITLIESKKPEHKKQASELLDLVMPFTGKSIRIGITGVPGAGKSTFIENFGKLAISHGRKVAVLAIDPSSAVNKGSILGDKTRMEELSKEENAFIRPSPSSGFLGGVANTTFETMLICESAGYDFILIETVGVGQSETLVAEIADIFLMLKLIGSGDELQGIKRGIMEMADLIFINKINSENMQKAKQTRAELLRALQFLPKKENQWKVPVLLGSALENSGLEEVYQAILNFSEILKKGGQFTENRKKNAEKRFEFWVYQSILEVLKGNKQDEELFNLFKKNASDLLANPSTEARKWADIFLKH